MQTISYQELKRKDVVDVDSGKNLGRISDLIFKEKSLAVITLIVPGKKNGFLNCDNLEINADCIEKIGADAILVRFGKRKKDCEPNVCKPPCESECGAGLVDFYDDTV
ncbi:MAG: YlmC/YmxH family sporulation protein [Clostridia bacterium]|nr:YlmC/YmxH family sporulation protein [Clostridia bacterium]